MAALVPENPRHPLPAQGGDRPKGLNALGTLAQHPDLTRAFNTFNGHILFGTTLSLRQRELIVLRVADLRDCEYEWKQHLVQGSDAGISPRGDRPGWPRSGCTGMVAARAGHPAGRR